MTIQIYYHGLIRIKPSGSGGTHNGLKSVIARLGTEEFIRVRVGIGIPEHKDFINHVIGHIQEEEKKVLAEGIEKAKKAVVDILVNGVDSAMNKYN